MSKPQITIKDIARELGVSPSTVSRALKDNPDISQETRDAIHKYAREHNYKPNVLALNLRTSRSNTIGVIIPQLVHHFFSCVLSGIERTAAEAGYNILVAQSNEEYEREVKIVHSFLAARVCGVITSLAKDTSRYDHYQELLDNNIPIVFYDRICTGINTERVVVDDYAGSFAAVEYMIQTGCKRIFFYSAAPHLEISKNRRNGYMDAMKKYRIPVDQSMIKLCDSREKAIAITPALLERPDHPDGFFAINDETASGILYSCKLTGRKVPDEVSICGFTDGAIAQSTDPKLTTVEQHGEEVGKSTIRLLIDKLEGNDEGKSGNKIVRTELSGSKFTILLVEDNVDLLNLTRESLSTWFKVLKAQNGRQALEVLANETVDVIVSDVMMPEMNGLELTAKVKSDIEYSHIPVILLTAKTTLEAKVEGFECGADVYIEKPFSIRQLRKQIENLLKLRQAFHKMMSELSGGNGAAPISPVEYSVSQKDCELMAKVRAAVEAQLSDENFSVDTLAESLNMSRSNFYRKIKALAGMPPNDYLKTIRLNKAAELLKSGVRITEVCEKIGFSSSSYFAKCFKIQFGVLPKDYH